MEDKIVYFKTPCNDECYFFDIMNTVYPEYLAKVMEHANQMRMTA